MHSSEFHTRFPVLFRKFFDKKRLYKPFLKTYYISNIFHGANAAQPIVQHPNTIKEGFIYARKEKRPQRLLLLWKLLPLRPRSLRPVNLPSPLHAAAVPPLAPELYVEFSGKQYNVTDIIDRAKADYRATHKVGVQSCKVYVKPEEDAAYYVINKVSGKLEL